MQTITDNSLHIMEEELKRALPPEFSNFVYEVESEDSLLIQFMLDEHPSGEQIKKLRDQAFKCIDSSIPFGETVSSWLAVVKVGAERRYNLAVGGTTIASFMGSTIKYGHPSIEIF